MFYTMAFTFNLEFAWAFKSLSSFAGFFDNNDLIRQVVVLLTGSGCIGYSVSMLNCPEGSRSVHLFGRWPYSIGGSDLRVGLRNHWRRLLNCSSVFLSGVYRPSEKLSGSPFSARLNRCLIFLSGWIVGTGVRWSIGSSQSYGVSVCRGWDIAA